MNGKGLLGKKTDIQRWQKVSIRNRFYFYLYISQHSFPVASHFFNYLLQIIYQLSALSSVWLIFPLQQGILVTRFSLPS